MFEIHNPAGKQNTSSYGGTVLNFDKKGVARVEHVSGPLALWLRAAGYKVIDLDETPEAETVFDPSEHDVKAVMAYLADADEVERERVLEAEKAGKARTSVLGKTGDDEGGGVNDD